ncbi:MAG: hypothetical protein E6J65_04705 [Deltaproteobacteria bacterium]|nr:MAG: hypothetical protein E6J65_04705 [Deltaproteobacteria bacterium]
MKRSFDLAVKAAAAAAFVLCVECFVWRRRCRIEKHAVSPRARLRVRREADARRVIFSIEGTLDEFAARLLAYSVAQVPPSATAIIDLSAAAPIRGGALALFARVFAAGRRVRLRGLGEGHDGLLALRPVLRQTEWDRQPGPEAASFAELRSVAA